MRIMITTSFHEKDQMMTFYIQKAKGQLHTVTKSVPTHYSMPHLKNGNLNSAWTCATREEVTVVEVTSERFGNMSWSIGACALHGAEALLGTTDSDT